MTDERINAVTVCVGYDDLLRLTLPTMAAELDSVTVVTHPSDTATIDHLSSCGLGNVYGFTTDAFYRGGAKFNKGLALEEAFEWSGREGWFLVIDADILLPRNLKNLLPDLQLGKLYGMTRRVLADPSKLTDTLDWSSLPTRTDLGLYGYFQLFHASDPVLVERPWYGVDWIHAGGCDKEFQEKWKLCDKIRHPSEVLHLGTPDENWFGRSSKRLDGREPEGAEESRRLQEKLKRKYGWGRRRTNEVMREKLEGPP